MRFDFSFDVAVFLGLAILTGTANAVCGAGEVAIGNKQMCNYAIPSQPGCGGNFGGIFATNCGTISSSWVDDSFCKGNWGKSGSVKCDGTAGNSRPVHVYTTGGDFGNCYRVNDRSCSTSIGIATTFVQIVWCCKRF